MRMLTLIPDKWLLIFTSERYQVWRAALAAALVAMHAAS
jgi:hypothetical protein